MAARLSTAADFDERLAVEDGQLATWRARKEGKDGGKGRKEGGDDESVSGELPQTNKQNNTQTV